MALQAASARRRAGPTGRCENRSRHAFIALLSGIRWSVADEVVGLVVPANLSHTASSLSFALAGSVRSALMACLQAIKAFRTFGSGLARVVPVAVVGLVVAAAGAFVAVVGPVVAAAGAAVLVVVVVLPQPAISNPPADAMTSHVDSFRIIDCPSWKTQATGRFSDHLATIPCYPSQARSTSGRRTPARFFPSARGWPVPWRR